MKYTVYIDRTTVERASFEVDSDTPEAAEEMALKLTDEKFPDFGEVQAIEYEVTLVEETK